MASAVPGAVSADDPAELLSRELDRRGLTAPAAILLDAHRPLLPLLRQAAIFLGPLAAPIIGQRRFGALRLALDDPDAYERLIARLAPRPTDDPGDPGGQP